jgi:DNA-binding LacI/PurR family transcriptional regulator
LGIQIENTELRVEEIAELYERDPSEINDAYEEWFDLRRGRQRPSAPDIRLLASLSNLSTTSVSNFLRNKTGSVSELNAQRLAKLIEIVGYVPSSAAQSLRGRQTNVIGIALPLSSVSPDFYLEILSGINQEADVLGYQHFIFNITTEEARDEFFGSMPFLGIVDGLIVVGLYIDESRLRILERHNLPLAVIHNRVANSPVVSNLIAQDESTLNELLDRHLIKHHGYRRLALVTLTTANPLKMGDAIREDWSRVGRINAYTQALQANQIEYDPEIVFEVKEHSFSEGYLALERILDRNKEFSPERKIEAIVCTSDTLAAGILTAASRHNLNFPVTGFDNLPVAGLMDITTVDQRAMNAGRQSFRHLYNAMSYYKRKGEYPAFVEESINMQVVIRRSCGCTS